ncbi:hypothetical protein [Lacinutrix sp. MedPE-SW]|uniref:hypothetical protein n=1 Tax=Lacinutrix sp. MedPE-SW TaxID=1860087 RepID=UPI000917BC53|nr:hypothetical protein [Lacinutrix sp. MedPE-SW]OIQ23478.1 MAG: hypothetical protein BM549_02635 [Lacinutrix sp. MedPE-SW]
MKNHFLVLFIAIIIVGTLTAQEAVPFKTENEFYIYGDAVVIGNNILSKHANEPFNDLNFVNDDIDMKYVDIDNDETTFSSSAAQLNIPSNHTKIKYAALYWSATYSYEQGYRQESTGQFLFQGKRAIDRKHINKVKFKLPNQAYKNISGKVIFDGADNSNFTLNSPYVCMADVTKLLKSAKQVNGNYTIANIKATKGFISGGSAAGWLLYVVYEAPTKNPKYITTYNGFAPVSGKPVKLNFSNFKALEKGDINTSITLAALEGDTAITEDECIIVNPQLKKVAFLTTKNRPRDNVFNSKITVDDTVFTNRTPNSENTLGFDIITKNISNANKPVIDNNTTEIELALNTESDRFYLFFTAFQTEITKANYEENKVEELVQNNGEKTKKITQIKNTQNAEKEDFKLKKNKDVTIINKEKIKLKKPAIFTSKTNPENQILNSTKTYKPNREDKPLPIWLQKKDNITQTPINDNIYRPKSIDFQELKPDNSLVLNRENYEKVLTPEDYVYETQSFKRILNQDATYIQGLDKGYYIIASLNSDLDESIAYQNELKEKGVNSKMFKDIPNNKYYLYLFNSENFYDVFMLRKAFIKSPFLENVWILNINIDSKIIKKL